MWQDKPCLKVVKLGYTIPVSICIYINKTCIFLQYEESNRMSRSSCDVCQILSRETLNKNDLVSLGANY